MASPPADGEDRRWQKRASTRHLSLLEERHRCCVVRDQQGTSLSQYVCGHALLIMHEYRSSKSVGVQNLHEHQDPCERE